MTTNRCMCSVCQPYAGTQVLPGWRRTTESAMHWQCTTESASHAAIWQHGQRCTHISSRKKYPTTITTICESIHGSARRLPQCTYVRQLYICAVYKSTNITPAQSIRMLVLQHSLHVAVYKSTNITPAHTYQCTTNPPQRWPYVQPAHITHRPGSARATAQSMPEISTADLTHGAS